MPAASATTSTSSRRKPSLKDEPTAAAIAYSQAERRLDLGELICHPAVIRTPSWVHPNHLTALNHALCWPFWLLSQFIPYLSPVYRVIGLLIGSTLNWCCMMLDTMDGMHARRTGQVSRLGEFLDHWLDAIHVPLLATGTMSVLQLNPLLAIAVTLFNVTVYHSEMLVYHYLHQWMPTNGVEGQLAITVFYLIQAYFAYNRYTYADSTVTTTNTILGIIVCIAAVPMTYKFVSKFTTEMYYHAAYYQAMNVIISLLYVLHIIPATTYFLLIAVVSFRVTGNLVLYSLLRQRGAYNEFVATADLWVWLTSIVVTTTMLPTYYLPLSDSVVRALASVINSLNHTIGSNNKFTLSAYELQSQYLTVQAVLPYVFAVYVMTRQYMTMRQYTAEFKKPQVGSNKSA